MCWDHWNGDVMPTLDTVLLYSSKAGSDLGRVSGLVIFPQAEFDPPKQRSDFTGHKLYLQATSAMYIVGPFVINARYHINMPRAYVAPSERLLEFDTRSNSPCHHGRLSM